MAAKAKDKKEKGKKGKNKGEKPRQEVAAEVALPPVAALPAKVSSPAKERLPAPATAPNAPPIGTSDAILDAVIECVALGGIEGLTTRRIAAQAGVNEVTIFRHFGSKDGLLDAVFAREAARMKSGAIQYSANLEGDLVRIVMSFEEALVRRPGVLPILVEVARRKSPNQSGGSGLPWALDEVTALLERYMKEGKLRREPSTRALAALVGPLFVGALLAPVTDKFTVIDVREHVRAFLHGRAAA